MNGNRPDISLGRTIVGRVLAFLGLGLLAPVLLVVACVNKLESRGPIFYRHPRIGRGGQPFMMLKFRTMYSRADREGIALTVSNDPRVTRFGRFLRKYRLDELPQLVHVLAGEMQLVGPRPEYPGYARRYGPAQKAVLDLHPGITDPGSIAFLQREAELISGSPDPEQVYLERVIPQRAEISLAYAKQATVMSDMITVLVTVRCLFNPDKALDRGRRLAGLLSDTDPTTPAGTRATRNSARLGD